MNVEPPERLVIIESIVYKSNGFAIDQRLPADVVKEALSSFDWINENFVLSQDNSCT